MIFDFSNFRRKFPDDFKYIDQESFLEDPFKQCALWFQDVLDQEILDGNAMTLSTANQKGIVSSRIVLLKYLTKKGFTFFTNYNSRKGQDLHENPHASITFYWPSLNRQLRVLGTVQKTSLAESTAYFNSRPKGSRLLALASNQSKHIHSLEDVLGKIKELELKYKDTDPPLPNYWGGYCLSPSEFEFWQGGPYRVNLRFSYIPTITGTWKIQQLSP